MDGGTRFTRPTLQVQSPVMSALVLFGSMRFFSRWSQNQTLIQLQATAGFSGQRGANNFSPARAGIEFLGWPDAAAVSAVILRAFAA